MKVNYQNNRDISFNGILNNKFLKKSLEFAADNGTLFAATASLSLSGIRPLVILATPKTDTKNKQVACSKSIMSTINGYLIALACSLPVARAVKKIDKNPDKFLSKETVESLKDGKEKLTNSKAYAMATQLFKLGLGFLIAAPKSIITAFGTPYILDLFNTEKILSDAHRPVNENISFKQKENLPKAIGSILNKRWLQNFAKKYKDTNFPLHIVAATDVVSTATFVQQTKKNKKLDDKDKKPLIYNSLISTGLCIASTYTIDKLTEKSTQNLIEKYKKINYKDPNLSKQIQGIKIAKPILIAGCIYYILIPLISTFFAERIQVNKKETSLQ